MTAPPQQQQTLPPSRQTTLLARRLAHLSQKLHPLLSITTGLPHPAFPPTLLHYHLLTDRQLDDLAHYYHQRTPSDLSLGYPAPVVLRWHVPVSPPWSTAAARGWSEEEAEIERLLRDAGLMGEERKRGEVGVAEKRRRFGRFVGLRGCESPTAVVVTPRMAEVRRKEEEARWEMERWMEGEMRRREERERERMGWRGKGYW